MSERVRDVNRPPHTFDTLIRPRVISSNLSMIDVTHSFRTAASQLLPGTLTKDEQFTLFESVGALEIGDPKMDSGCLDNNEDLDSEYDLQRVLQPTEVLWLMDELLSREVAWHMGYPLSQTLFTSVYIDSLLWPNPTRLADARFGAKEHDDNQNPLLHKLFRAYCLGLVKTCDLVLGMVKSQHYYEEEDFATQLFNRELLNRFSPGDILAELHEASLWLQNAEIVPHVLASLEMRMQFRYMLLQSLVTHSEVPATHPTTAYDNHNLLAIELSAVDGTPVLSSFNTKIQQRLASTIPPRPMVTIDQKKAFHFWTQALKDMSNAFQILELSHNDDVFTAFSTLCGQRPQPSVYTRALIQSFLSRNDQVCGRMDSISFVTQDLRHLTFAGSRLLALFTQEADEMNSDDILIGQRLRAFLIRVERSYLNIYRTLSLNRCRMRRTLCHAATEWDQIQVDAEELDEELHVLAGEKPEIYPPGCPLTFSYSLSSWIYHHKLIQLRLIIQMGFELSIYAPYEMSGMYWFLSHICGIHLAHLERISYFISKREANLPPVKSRNSAEQYASQECHNALQLLYRHFSLLKATEAQARGLYLLYKVLERSGQFRQPDTTYSSDDLRYEIRMKPFSYLSIPEPMDFAQFYELSSVAQYASTDLLERAAVATTSAKKAWEEILRAGWNVSLDSSLQGEDIEKGFSSMKATDVIKSLWVGDVRSTVKATIATSIAISNLVRLLKEPESVERSPSIDAKLPQEGEREYWHPWWHVPQIKM